MHANEPEMAERWEKETPRGKKPPAKKPKKRAKKDNGTGGVFRLY